ncbi:MAG: enoyl-CoA hydratase/isomerase family protein [Armatimonadetes bacterium]|nr:enoyl-CoA hydratase/isomerase family protein [Armatimonadota bacterium]
MTMLKTSQDGPVLHVTLDRPEVRNALNDELIAALTDAIVGMPAATRVVVLGGEGKAYCAGGDLEWMRRAANYTEEQNYEDAMKLGRLFEAIATCRAVVVSRVQGAAFGGGSGLVAASDVAIAEENTLFAFSEAKLGLIPATISSFVLNKIGSGNARWLFTTAEAFDAATALRVGLVHEVTNIVDLDAAVERKVKAVLKCGPEAVAASKRLCMEGPLPMDRCARMLATARSGQEGREGVAAFLEKRPASFVAE